MCVEGLVQRRPIVYRGNIERLIEGLEVAPLGNWLLGRRRWTLARLWHLWHLWHL